MWTVWTLPQITLQSSVYSHNCYPHLMILRVSWVPHTGTRDVMWLHCMYYGNPETSNEVVVYQQVALPLELKEAEARDGVMLNASETDIKSHDEENKWNTVSTRSDRVVKPSLLYMNEYGSDRVDGALGTIPELLCSIMQTR